MNKKEISLRKLVSNTEYVKWLEKYMKEHESISTFDITSCKSKRDANMIKKFPLFYHEIELYAKRNFIYPIVTGEELFECYNYNIKFNDIIYTISWDSSFDSTSCECTYYSCSKYAISGQAIDFNDIMNNKDRDSLELVKSKVNTLKNSINDLYELDVSLDTIDTIVKEANFKLIMKDIEKVNGK